MIRNRSLQMAEIVQAHEIGKDATKRKMGNKKNNKAKKKMKVYQGSREVAKMDRKMKKLFQKRARNYNSDDDDDDNSAPITGELHDKDEFEVKSSDDEDKDHEDAAEENYFSDDEDGGIQPGITKFTEGCKAFRMAFKKITKGSTSGDVLGPVLSAHKKLVAEKLAEEEEEQRIKGEAKREKHLVAERGHVKPANYLDSREKFLIGVATKGVVKLFNAVNKAQHAQKGLNPSRSKDAKVIKKQRREAFFSALDKTSSQSTDPQGNKSTGTADGDGPAWAPLRDNYMLTSSKLKNWDKMPETAIEDDFGQIEDSSSEDD